MQIVPYVELQCVSWLGRTSSTPTSGFEEDHDVGGATVDLLKVQRSDIAVEPECLSDRCIHFPLTQISCVLGYSKM